MDEEQRGYTAMKHDIMENIYSPDCPLDSKTRVFMYITHRLIRDWKYVKSISRKEILIATGVEDRNLTRVLKFLEKNKMIISHKSKTGSVWNHTQYALHPKKFTLDTLWRGKDGKGEHIEKENENQTLSVHPDGKIIPITRKGGTVSQTGRVPVPQTVGGPVYQTGQTGLKFSELQDLIASKNPLKEPILKKPTKIQESFTLSDRERELQKQWLVETDGLLGYPEWLQRKSS